MPEQRIRYRLRGDTAANWAANNPVLLLDEPGVEEDTGFLKLGDGVAAWVDLPYFSGSGGGGGAPDATTAVKGIVRLAGDLAGTAALPTVPGVATNAAAIAAEATTARAAESTLSANVATNATAIAAEATTARAAESTLTTAKVDKATLDANSVLYAVTDDTPAALAMAASTILARLAAGNIVAATPPQLKTLLAIAESDVTNLASDLAAKLPIVEAVNTVATSGSAQTIPDPTVQTISRITLTANCTFTFPTAAAGKSFTLVLVQDGTGSRAATWPGTVKWPGAVAPTLSTGAGKIDYLSFVCTDGTNWAGFVAGQDMR